MSTQVDTRKSPSNNSHNNSQKTNIREESVYKRIQTLIEHSKYESTTLCFRVPKYIKIYYESLYKDEKRVVKEMISRVIESFFNQVMEERRVVNINVNINLVKAEARITSSEDVEVLKHELDLCNRKLRLCKEELKLSRSDRELERLRERFNYLLKELRKLYFSSSDRVPKIHIYKLLKEVGGV